MTVLVGHVTLPVVALRGNDCENGLPEAYDVDEDGFTSCAGDCDDRAAEVHPGGYELGDGVDQDCDGVTDEGTDLYDDDGDGLTELQGDCNDGAPGVEPAAPEVLGNGIDDDCDGVVDLGTTDADADGYAPDLGADCDDADDDVYPGAPEIADGLDNDCDGAVDEGTVWVDNDGDGYCVAIACSDGSTPGDCDDTTSLTHPGAAERADWLDNDCNGVVDDGTVNHDDDADGYTETGGDCDDGDPAISPGLGTC
jgi:hypothetical protein